MTQREDELFEAELRRINPSRAPKELVSRLIAAKPIVVPEMSQPRRPVRLWDRLFGQRPALGWWMASATSAAAIIIVATSLTWLRSKPTPDGALVTRVASAPASEQSRGDGAAPDVLNADNVEIERNLVTSYEAVAELPDGVPVRFSCREWEDRVSFRDSNRGVTVERSVPRLEIVPVKFETY